MRSGPSLILGTLLILAGIGIALLATFITFILPPKFASTARVEPGVTDPAALATEVEKIQSQQILHQVITNLSLARLWGERYKEGELPMGLVSLLLKKDVAVSRSRNTHLIEIKVEGDTPEEASLIANKIAEVYRDSAFAPKGPDGKPAVQIIDKAEPNLRPSRPNKLLNIASGCGIGAVLAIIGIALMVAGSRSARPAPAR